MKLKDEKVNNEKLYSIGYNDNLNKYILSCVVPWGVWYKRYYEISEEEYNSFDNNLNELDVFVDCLRENSYVSDRFLFSDKQNENSKAQSELKAIAMGK